MEKRVSSSWLIHEIKNKRIREKNFTLVIALDNFDRFKQLYYLQRAVDAYEDARRVLFDMYNKYSFSDMNTGENIYDCSVCNSVCGLHRGIYPDYVYSSVIME